MLGLALARAWATGAGPGNGRLVVDVDSFVGEVHGYQKQGAADFNNNPVGAGPYTMKSWVRDSQMVMVRNPNYWNGAAYVDELEIISIADATARVNHPLFKFRVP